MSRRSVALLLTLSALWGASYLFIKVALDDVFSPWAIVSIRTALAALVLVPLAARMGVLGSLRGRAGAVLVLALVQVAVPLSLIGLGEERISSSLTGILVASAPIFTFLLAFALTGEQRASLGSLVGVAIGIVGVGMLLGVDAGGGTAALVGGLFVISAAFGYAVAAWHLKRNLVGVEPVATVAGSQAIAALVTLPLGLAHVPDATPGLDAIASLFVLGVFCTGIAFVIFHYARGQRRAGAGVARRLHRSRLLDLLRRRAARRALHGRHSDRARADPRRLVASGGRRAARTPPRCRGRG